MITTPTTLPPQVQQHFDDVLLSVQTPRLIHKLGAIAKHIPAKGGNTLRMSRYQRLPTFPVPLASDGSTPPATPVSRVDIDAKISIYGEMLAVLKSVLIDLETYGVCALG